ncbi:hypothetical protein G6F64_014882 [Rhizopus arrhizus]|uniref:Uncharacterized protein n=1 Tax=Rhizopus oryzae TaxID=64495 RepID=A0A9P7BJ69_RHIOR|nr:hypothetical protein G6F64_014882 [Rhizopus arrhizus]
MVGLAADAEGDLLGLDEVADVHAIGQHGIQRQEFLFVGQGATGADIKAEEAVGAALRHIQRLAVGRDH